MKESDIEKIMNGECKNLVYIGNAMGFTCEEKLRFLQRISITKDTGCEKDLNAARVIAVYNNCINYDLSALQISYNMAHMILKSNDKECKLGDRTYNIHNFIISDEYAIGDTCIAIIDGELVYGYISNVYPKLIFDKNEDQLNKLSRYNIIVVDNIDNIETPDIKMGAPLVEYLKSVYFVKNDNKLYRYKENGMFVPLEGDDINLCYAENLYKGNLSYTIDYIDFTYTCPKGVKKGRTKTIKILIDNHGNGYYNESEQSKLIKTPLYKTDNTGIHLYDVDNTEIDIGMNVVYEPGMNARCVQKIMHNRYYEVIDDCYIDYTFHIYDKCDKNPKVVIETDSSQCMLVNQDSVKIKPPVYMIGDVIDTDLHRYIITRIKKDFYQPIGSQYTYTMVRAVRDDHGDMCFKIINDIPESNMDNIERYISNNNH